MAPLTRIRFALVMVMLGLFVAGVTAFPLLAEVDLLSRWLVGEGSLDPGAYTGLSHWILTVRAGLEATYRDYPFVAYGTDWLAFGHLMIMLFFVLPYRDPVRYEGVMWVGVWSSLLVFPLALICGPLRGIPFYWRLIDCSFGMACVPWLGWAIRETRGLRDVGGGGVGPAVGQRAAPLHPSCPIHSSRLLPSSRPFPKTSARPSRRVFP